MFNIKKYKGQVFHENPSINKKIEALFLKYDKDVNDRRLNYNGKIKLINIFIATLIEHEEYEVAAAFRQRKFNKYKKYRLDRRNGKIPLMLRLRIIRIKLLRYFNFN